MKKILLTLISFYFLSACDKDDNDCKCDIAKYYNPDNEMYINVTNVPINCDDGNPTGQPQSYPNAVFIQCMDDN